MAIGTASAAAAAGKVKAATPPGAEPAVGDPTARVKTNKNAAKIFGSTSKVPMHGDEVHNSPAPFKSKNMPNKELKDLRSNDKNIDLDKGNNMPVKRSGFGPSTAFGGVNNPELTKTNKGMSVNDFDDTVTKSNSPAGYAPFKMMGHEHPGIKQKAPLEMSMEKTHINENMVDGVNKKPGSGINYGAAVGSSPAKGFFDSINNLITGKNKATGTSTNIGTKPPEEDTPVEGGGDVGVVPPHGDEAHSGGAIGGEPQPAAFEAMGHKEFRGMNSGDRREYMQGLSTEDRRAQMKSNIKSMSPWGGGGAGNISNLFSDIRLKENIDRVGSSKSGIPIYEFNYIGDNNRYSGAMAQDLLGTNAVSVHESGFYMVDYNSIDINMKLI